MVNALQSLLAATLADQVLSDSEQEQLQLLRLALGDPDVRKLRSKAFDLAEEHIVKDPGSVKPVMGWLKRVLYALELRTEVRASAHFSPGEDCLKAVLDFCASTTRTLDVCVFTISDNRIARALRDCQARGIAVRIISDNEKQTDAGSDISWLMEVGIPVRMDHSRTHMHHKFALADGQRLLTGSFNWTRAAVIENEENLLITDHPGVTRAFTQKFEALWRQYGIEQDPEASTGLPG